MDHALSNDRIFWIYFIIVLFFIIMGMTLLMSVPNPHILALAIVWMLANVLLLLVVYHIFKVWRLQARYSTLVAINLVFLGMLILSVLWAGELSHTEAGALPTMSGILIILGGLFLVGIYHHHTPHFIASPKSISPPNHLILGLSTLYLVIWFILTLYVTIA